jgi:hypothetical protein
MAGLSGVIVLVLLAVMMIFALPCIRRRGLFELFSWTHRLYVPFLVMLVIHSPPFWHYLTLPGCLLLLELLGERCEGVGAFHSSKVLSLVPLASGVTQVVIRRPEHFEFRTGTLNLPRSLE